jgi:Tol biopolymer transport system component
MMRKSRQGTPWFSPLRPLILGVALLALLAAYRGGDAGQESLLEVQALAGMSAPGASSPDILASAILSNTLFLPSISRCAFLGSLIIDGPTSATIGVPQTFTASAVPATAGLPITFTWQVTGHDPVVVVVNGLQDVQTFSWELTGDKVITVQAVNRCDSATATWVTDLTTRGLIAFERRYCEPRQPDGSQVCYPHDIWVRSHDGAGVEINLTNTPDLDEGVPTWSPDGHFLAYAAGPVDGSQAIHKMDLRTRNVVALTDGTYDERWPAWSPLGDRIAFMRKTPGELQDVYLMNPDGSGLFKLTDWLYGDRFPAWSRDGQWIAFSSDRFYASEDLYIVRPNDPSSVRIVLQTNIEGEDDLRDEIYPSWSPDGWIYYTFVYRDAPADTTEYLYRIRPDGTYRTKVFSDSYQRYVPSFSPDGQCFVFYSYMGGADKEVWKWCNGAIAAVNLTNNGDLVADEYCAWSPVP